MKKGQSAIFTLKIAQSDSVPSAGKRFAKNVRRIPVRRFSAVIRLIENIWMHGRSYTDSILSTRRRCFTQISRQKEIETQVFTKLNPDTTDAVQRPSIVEVWVPFKDDNAAAEILKLLGLDEEEENET